MFFVLRRVTVITCFKLNRKLYIKLGHDINKSTGERGFLLDMADIVVDGVPAT
jgi:hypothetical protein